MNEQHGPSTSRGFTLLEVIIASSLAAVLMLLVWSLFGIYSKLNDKGTGKATELQLVRSLMDQLRTDLHHASAAMTARRPGIAANPFGRFGTVQIGESPAPSNLPSGASLQGSETQLRLVVRSGRSDEAIDQASEMEQDWQPVPNVYERIEYAWQPPFDESMANATLSSDGEFPLGPADERADEQREPSASGLTRRVTPWFQSNHDSVDGASVASRGADSESIAMNAEHRTTTNGESPPRDPGQVPREDAIPEIARWRFRYFDGSRWLSQWDSGPDGRMPAAIEVSFDLSPELALKDESASELSDEMTDDPSRRVTDQSMANRNGEPSFGSSFNDPTNAGIKSKIDDDGLANEYEYEHEYRFVIAVDTGASRRARNDEVVP